MTAAAEALPEGCDPRLLDLDPAPIARVVPLPQRHGHAVYRLECGAQSFVLKWFPAAAPAVEVDNYVLLEAHGVPTPPVHARVANALLLEDLATSPLWRLATAADVQRAHAGRAIAAWHQALHAAGPEVLANPAEPPAHLRREADALDPRAVRELGARLGLGDAPVWGHAADAIEALKDGLRALPETLTHGDFHWTNLALSRRRGRERRAPVFDYHLLGIGPAASEYRNVLSGLGAAARAAFREAYGPVDERALRLEAPIALLYALSLAVRRPQFPAWAHDCLRAVQRGAFARSLERALAAL